MLVFQAFSLRPGKCDSNITGMSSMFGLLCRISQRMQGMSLT
jgi:hypothetical protein